MRVAFVTMASEDYFPGAIKLFSSIKLQNPTLEFESILLSNEPANNSEISDLFDEIVILPKKRIRLAHSELVPRFQFTLNKLYVLDYFEKSSFDRLVFFDADLLCTSPLTSFLSPKLNKFDFLAVRDFASMNYYSDKISFLGLDSNRIFNSGCFVLNRSILDAISYSDLIRIAEKSNYSYDGGDQGYFNYALQNSTVRFGRLSLRFNYPLDINYPWTLNPPSLIHFSGEKPWLSSHNHPSWDSHVYQWWRAEGKWKNRWFSQNSPNVWSWQARYIGIFRYKCEIRFRLLYIRLRSACK
jgi:lipopolysaccharide biosynthesis glycosyltransferase